MTALPSFTPKTTNIAPSIYVVVRCRPLYSEQSRDKDTPCIKV